jgi:hypothetical protein
VAKRLVTEADVAARTSPDPLVVDEDTIVTPSALDLAHARGIPVVYKRGQASLVEGSESAHKGGLTPFADGLYLVRIEGGRRTVIRLSP